MFGIFALFSESGLSFWERIAAWYQNSVLKELLTYFGDRYFSVEFGVYENFSVSATAGTTARNIILAIAAGLIIASIMTAYTRTGLGGFVRKLLKEECVSPESAKTLIELGYFRSTMIRRELTRGSSLRMVVRCREEEESIAADAKDTEVSASQNGNGTTQNTKRASKTTSENRYRPNFLTAHFYIPEDLRYRAEVRFDQKGSGWGLVVLIAVLTVVAAAVLCWFLPDVLVLADNLISVFAP